MATVDTVAVPVLKCLLRWIRRHRLSPLSFASLGTLTTAYAASATLAALGERECRSPCRSRGSRRALQSPRSMKSLCRGLRTPVDMAISEGRKCGVAIAKAGRTPSPPRKLVLAAPATDLQSRCSLLA